MAAEFELLEAILKTFKPTDALVGPGEDDAAVLGLGGGRYTLTSDMLVEGVDFMQSFASPADIGFKAAAVSLSDIAAMGAKPTYMTVAIGAPTGDPDLFTGLGHGLQEACEPHGCSIVGGDISKSMVLTLCTTVMGKIKTKPALRKGALPGDLILCTGNLGAAAAGLIALLKNVPGYKDLKERQLRPKPQVEAGQLLAEHGLITSMLDISDGLIQDLGHLCEQSKVQAVLWLEHLPISTSTAQFCTKTSHDSLQLACTGGEDFELLFTAPASKLFQIEEVLAQTTTVQVLGEITAVVPTQKNLVCLKLHGQDYEPTWQSRPGFKHFEK